MNVVIIGFKGEVGRALYELVRKKHKVWGIDQEECELPPDKADPLEQAIDVMHVCIPYGPKFVKTVKDYQAFFSPALTIIESTVPVWTTQQFEDSVHSPIRGTHPNMLPDLKRYTKFIGADNHDLAVMASAYYQSLGLKTWIASNSRTTELLKLMNTSYYGLLCAWFKETHNLCKKFDADYADWREFVKTTNEYTPRPLLYPPLDGFGGHCVRENAVLLREQTSSPFLDLILKIPKKESK